MRTITGEDGEMATSHDISHINIHVMRLQEMLYEGGQYKLVGYRNVRQSVCAERLSQPDSVPLSHKHTALQAGRNVM